MKKVAVYIATTNGPVQIELISEEKIPRSEVVLSGDFIPLDSMSSEYHHFVIGSGPVSKAFGPFLDTSFHMEVSSPIDSGRSWHLAALIAHGVVQNNELAGAEEEPDQIIWATGRLGNNFEVEADHLNEKLKLSKGLLDDAKQKGTPVLIFGPAGIKKPDISYTDATVFEVANGYSALDDLSINYNKAQSPPSAFSTKNSIKNRIKFFTALGASVIFLFFMAQFNFFQFDWLSSSNNQQTKKQDEKSNKAIQTEVSAKPSIKKSSDTQLIAIYALKPPPKYNCAEVHLKNIDGELSEVKLISSSKLEVTRNKNICGIALKLNPNHNAKKITLKLDKGKFVNASSKQINIEDFDGNLFYLYTPQFLEAPIEYSVYVETKDGQSRSIAHTVSP